ncbi:hypothetical protein, partial [Vibrio parahaemolyticus]|uniref:hypothetical protein n=1 Tax=Vibrio parahaemolyticus TaxID=670 RepID=UPI001C5F4965
DFKPGVNKVVSVVIGHIANFTSIHIPKRGSQVLVGFTVIVSKIQAAFIAKIVVQSKIVIRADNIF